MTEFEEKPNYPERFTTTIAYFEEWFKRVSADINDDILQEGFKEGFIASEVAFWVRSLFRINSYIDDEFTEIFLAEVFIYLLVNDKKIVEGSTITITPLVEGEKVAKKSPEIEEVAKAFSLDFHDKDFSKVTLQRTLQLIEIIVTYKYPFAKHYLALLSKRIAYLSRF